MYDIQQSVHTLFYQKARFLVISPKEAWLVLLLLSKAISAYARLAEPNLMRTPLNM